MSDASAFRRDGDDRGVLCLHGFTGTPFEMRFLGESLAARGMTVVGPALVGHGQTLDALDVTTWRDWHAGVCAEFDALRARCRSVAVVGQSLGGLLALHLARERGAELSSLCVMGVPLWLPPLARVAIPLVRELRRITSHPRAIPKRGGSDVRDPEMKRLNPCLPAFPVRALASLNEFTDVVRATIEQVTVPTLVAHGAHDHVAPPACGVELARRLGTSLLTLPRSYHLVSMDVDRVALAQAVGDFVAARFDTRPDARTQAR